MWLIFQRQTSLPTKPLIENYYDFLNKSCLESNVTSASLGKSCFDLTSGDFGFSPVMGSSTERNTMLSTVGAFKLSAGISVNNYNQQ